MPNKDKMMNSYSSASIASKPLVIGRSEFYLFLWQILESDFKLNYFPTELFSRFKIRINVKMFLSLVRLNFKNEFFKMSRRN